MQPGRCRQKTGCKGMLDSVHRHVPCPVQDPIMLRQMKAIWRETQI